MKYSTFIVIDVTQLHEYDPLAEVRSSLGYVVNFSKGAIPQHGQEPPNSYEILRDIYFNDPIVSTAVDLKAEIVLSNGWIFKGKNKRDVERAYKEFEKMNMYEVLLNFLKQQEAYGDAYLEPRYTPDGKLNEVWPLETPITRIFYDKNGVIQSYTQVANTTLSPDTLPITWQPDELLHYRANWIGSNVYSYCPTISYAHQLANRTLGNHYIQQIFKNLPPKMAHILKNAGSDQLKQYKQVLLAAKSNTNQDLVVRTPEGTEGVDIKQFEVDFNKNGLLDIIHYLREEVITRMRVPPALLGLTDNSGRSEPQMFIFETHIKNIQRRVASFLNQNLLPLMKLNCEIVFPPVMITSEEVILRNARAMIDAGITNEDDEENHPALVYLRSKGFNLPEGTTVEDPKEKDIDLMPSRLRDGRDSVGKEEKDNRTATGDSDESREKINRETQTRSQIISPFDEWQEKRKFN